jgi:hypothetical protein
VGLVAAYEAQSEQRRQLAAAAEQAVASAEAKAEGKSCPPPAMHSAVRGRQPGQCCIHSEAGLRSDVREARPAAAEAKAEASRATAYSLQQQLSGQCELSESGARLAGSS